MHYLCAFTDEYLVRAITEDQYCDSLSDALEKFDASEAKKAHRICDELKSKTSLALLLSALFSKEGESEEIFQKRHIENIKEACTAGNPLALYSMAVYLDSGDMVEESKVESYKYYEMASNKNMPLACHIYGIILYYGSEAISIDKERGLNLIRFAASKGVNDASIFLDSLSQQ